MDHGLSSTISNSQLQVERVWLFSVYFKKRRYSNEKSTKFESLKQEEKNLKELLKYYPK